MHWRSSAAVLSLPVLFVVFVSECAVAVPLVRTPLGTIRGFEHELPTGKMADVFLGVPFAEPPVGDLRFERPVPPKPWTGVLNATQFPFSCPVHEPFYALNADEDCLKMGIFRPSWKSQQPKGFPILVWIHGGSWVVGSIEQYGYKVVTNNFVPQGVIVVSIQYRLGPWGFFSTGDATMPGNIGLWDQLQALKVLRQLAPSFGGDPDRITLMGQSAGSASVSWLSVSEHADPLFSQAIELSGSMYALWARSDDTVSNSRFLANRLGCPTNDSRSLKSCLKGKSVEEIHKVCIGMGVFRQHINFAYFNPRIDHDFVKARNFDEGIRRAPKRPTLMSLMKQESLFWSFEQLGLVPADTVYNLEDTQVADYNRSALEAFIWEHVATREHFGAQRQEAGREIIAHYADDQPPTEPVNLFFFERFTQMLSDLHFNVPLVREARLKSLAGYPVFFQVMSYQKPLEVTEYPINGSLHGAELDALLGSFVYAGFESTEDDPVIRRKLSELVGAFVRTGNPSTRRFRFPNVTPRSFPFVDVNLRSTIKHNPFGSAYKFWEHMARRYGYDVSKGISLRRAAQRTPPLQPVRSQ